jgi:hypothetical protein
MKKILLTIGLALVAGIAVLVNGQTYTNGTTSPRLPISDQQVEQLRVIRNRLGQTNTPINQFATNHLAVMIKPESRALLDQLKTEIVWKVAACDSDTKLAQILAILDAP